MQWGTTSVVWAAAMVALGGCAAPVEAPTELSELARYMVREFDAADPAVRVAGADNFAALLDGVDYSASTADRATIPASLEADDVADLSRPPDTVLANTTDVTLFYGSRHPVSAHAAFTVADNQVDAEPSTASYVRTLLDGGDCFGDGSCERMSTVNAVGRENALFALDFTLFKDFRRLETSDGRDVLVSRSWTQEAFEASRGTAVLRQSWTLDVFVDGPDGAQRFRGNWAETTFDPPIDEDIARNTTRNGMQNGHELADEVLDE